MYTVDYFINKFEAIPEEEWTTDEFEKGMARCANGHCGMNMKLLTSMKITQEAVDLQKVFSSLKIHFRPLLNGQIETIEDAPCGYSEKAQLINDGACIEYQQPTPKQRILAALYDIKALEQQKDIDTGSKKEKIIYVAVPVTITEQAKELVMS